MFWGRHFWLGGAYDMVADQNHFSQGGRVERQGVLLVVTIDGGQVFALGHLTCEEESSHRLQGQSVGSQVCIYTRPNPDPYPLPPVVLQLMWGGRAWALMAKSWYQAQPRKYGKEYVFQVRFLPGWGNVWKC